MEIESIEKNPSPVAPFVGVGLQGSVAASGSSQKSLSIATGNAQTNMETTKTGEQDTDIQKTTTSFLLAPEAGSPSKILLEMTKWSGRPVERALVSTSERCHLEKLGKLLSDLLEFFKVSKNAHVFLKKGVTKSTSQSPRTLLTPLKRFHPLPSLPE